MKRLRWAANAGLSLVALASAAAQSCDPPPVSKEELREPIAAYVEYWAAIFAEAEKSGIPDPGSLFSKERIPEAAKRCEVVVQAAGERKNVQHSAKLLLSAYIYVTENIGLKKERRKR